MTETLTPEPAPPWRTLTMEPDVFAAIDALNEKQRDVLGFIYLGVDSGHHPKTVAVLVKRGLVEPFREELGGHLPMTALRFGPPSIWHHMIWCAWCSKHVPAEETESPQ